MNYKIKTILFLIILLGIAWQIKKYAIPENKVLLNNCLKNTKSISINLKLDNLNLSKKFDDKNLKKGIHIATLINKLDSNGDNYFEVTCKNLSRKVGFTKNDFNHNIVIQNIFQLLNLN